MFNHMLLEGRLSKEPEVKQTNSGKTVINFSLLHEIYRKDAENKIVFFDVTFWTEKSGYWLKFENLTKGNNVIVECRADVDSWETDDGQKRSRVKFVVNGAPSCKPSKENAAKALEHNLKKEQESSGQTYSDDFDDDLPF